MEQSPSWEANRFSDTQEIPRILMEHEDSLPYSQKPPPVPVMSQINLVHTPTSKFLKIYLNIILPSTPESSKWSLSLRFPHQKPLYASAHTRYMPRPSHSSLFYNPNKIGWAVKTIKFFNMYFSPLPVTSSLLGQNILITTLFSNTLSLRSSPKVSDQVSHPYETRNKITVLDILIFKCLDSKLEDKRFCTEW